MWHYRELKSHKMSANMQVLRYDSIVVVLKNLFSKSRNCETQMAWFVQPRSLGLFPGLRLGKRPWEGGCRSS